MAAQSYCIGSLSFVAFVLSFISLLRFPLRIGWFVLEILTGLIIHIVSSFAGFVLFDEFSYWYQASLYAFLWFCFFFVTSIYSASVSVGILSYLYEQPEYKAPLGDVYQHCIVMVFEQRAEFLVTAKQVQKTDQGYLATSAGRRTAERLQWIQKILGMESQGFYSSVPVLLINKEGIKQQ
jgi:hypothetical protein